MSESGYTVSHFLFDRLKQMGVRHVFGLPGDYAFPALAVVEEDPELTWLGECNELNAAIAANGYARFAGIGVCVVTAGVGEVAAAAGVGCAFSERVPLVLVAGHPALAVPAGHRQTHHSLLGDFAPYGRIYAELTVAQADFTTGDPAAEIDRVLQACWRERGPGYLQIPLDVQKQPAARPTAGLELPVAHSDPTQLPAFVEHLRTMIDEAQHPALLVNYPVGRYGLAPLVEQFAATTGIPFSLLYSAASSMIDQAHPENMGSYDGHNPGNPVSDRVDAADLIIRLATESDETVRGLAQPTYTAPHVVDLRIENASIGGSDPVPVAMADVLRELVGTVPRREIDHPAPPPVRTFTPKPHTTLSEQVTLDALNAFMEPDDVFVVDVGTCAVCAQYPMPARAKVSTQFRWGGIGYSIPMALGSMAARPDARHVVVVGDGALQYSAQELTTILRHGFAPIIVVLDNSRYLIENVTGLPEQEDNAYNVLQPWDYAALPGVLRPGDDSYTVRVHTEEQLAEAFSRAAKAQVDGRAALIDVVLAPTDVNQAMLISDRLLATG